MHQNHTLNKFQLFKTHENISETLIHTAEKSIADLGDKVKPDDKREVEDAITAVRGVIAGDDKEKIDEETKKLSEAMQKVGSAAYEDSKDEKKDGDKSGRQLVTSGGRQPAN